MKRILLFMTVSLVSLMSNAQVITYVEAPSVNEGSYEFTWAEAASGWGTPDLTMPANAITDTMKFVSDGVDSMACSPLTNDLTGKIAVLYRGSCEFGLKSLNAQNAGAEGVIIINNGGGSPVGMGGGADGPSVTIPVVMITDVSGALLKPEIIAENSTVFIGSKLGLYADDVGMNPEDNLRAESFAVNSRMNVDNTEFIVEVGSWVRNYGTNAQADVTLNCIIDNGGELYNETSALLNIPAGDSVYVNLPDFSQASYADGLYTMDYTVAMGATDEAAFDNDINCNFFFSDSLFSLGAVDGTDGSPIQSTNQFNGATDLMETCLHFRDENASRVGILGVTYSGGTSQNPDPTSTDGYLVEVYAYEWLDVFTDFNDYPDWNSADLNEIATGEYIYTDNMQGENIFIKFDDNPVLTDNQRYLFCLNVAGGTADDAFYPGYDLNVNYEGNFQNLLQPLNVLRTDFGQWFAAGFGTDRAPAMTINMYDAAEAGLVELPNVDGDAYPNPAQTIVNIPMSTEKGNAIVSMFDLDGKVVLTENVSMTGGNLVMDVSSIANGMYVIKLNFENGDVSTFNIVVGK